MRSSRFFSTLVLVMSVFFANIHLSAQKNNPVPVKLKPGGNTKPTEPKPKPADPKEKGKKRRSGKEIVGDTGKVIIKQEKNRAYMQLDTVYKSRIKLSKIEGVYIPKDLNDCFKELDKLMEEEVRVTFKAFADEEADRRTHASIGKWLEHKWSLTEGSRLSDYFNKMKVPHPDYMVGIILTSYHRYLHKRDIKLKEQVEFFRKKWEVKQREEAQKLIDRAK